MKYYHGTVKAYLPEILKEGLKPNKDNAWRVKATAGSHEGQELRDYEKVEFVYLVEDKSIARIFAKAKAEYLRMKPGEESSTFYMVKDLDAPVIKTTPVVLEVTLSDTAILDVDPHSESGLRYKGSIKPGYIKVAA